MKSLEPARLIERSRRREHLGTRVVVLNETASTNDDAHEEYAKHGPAMAGTVVIAEHQTAGRGQRGRVWTAPPYSSLLFSIIVDPPPPLAGSAFLTALGALAIARTLRARTIRAEIKWPNDLLVEERKIAGILVERRQATVVGIGLNVAIAPHEFPADVRLPATSVETILEQSVDRTDLLNDILDEVDEMYRLALTQSLSLDHFWNSWTEHAQPLVGLWVRVTTHGGEQTGRLLDLRPDRGLTLVDPFGETRFLPPEQILRVERQRAGPTSYNHP